MKVLKDPGQVLQIMDAKLDELHKKFREAKDELEETEVFRESVSIIGIAWHIRRMIEGHGYFDESDMADVYEYAAKAKGSVREYSNPRDTCYRKACAKGAAWALKEIEKRMENQPTMTDEEWSERITKEKKARAEAIGLPRQALQAAGVPLLSLEIIEDGSDCTVEAMFKYGARHWGVRYADISTDAQQTSLWDILRQIPELR